MSFTKVIFVIPDAPSTSSRASLPLSEHKNLDFVLETPENGGSERQKRTKTAILCSKCPKMGVLEGKSAQKPRFCAREDGKVASGIVQVAFLQITAHTFKT